MKLDVGRNGTGDRAGENSSLIDADRHRSAAGQSVLHAHLYHPPPALEVVVGGDRARAFEHDPRLQMILEILADTAELVHGRDAELVQQRWRADAGQLQ